MMIELLIGTIAWCVIAIMMWHEMVLDAREDDETPE